jgi:hypothetical protein
LCPSGRANRAGHRCKDEALEERSRRETGQEAPVRMDCETTVNRAGLKRKHAEPRAGRNAGPRCFTLGYTVFGVDNGECKQPGRKQLLRTLRRASRRERGLLCRMRTARRANCIAGRSVCDCAARASSTTSFSCATSQLRGREPAGLALSTLRFHSGAGGKARMEVDDGNDRQREDDSDLFAMRQ